MEEQKDRIPPHLRGLVLGGLRTGRLGDILGRFSGYMSIGTELKRKLWLSLAYPILSILVAITLFMFVNVVLVSQFERIFRDFGIPLPGLTIGMLLVSRFLREGWPALLIVAVGIAVLWLVLRVVLKPPDRRSLATKIPVIGAVWRVHVLGRVLSSAGSAAREPAHSAGGPPAGRRRRPEYRSGPGLPGHGRRGRAGPRLWPRPWRPGRNFPAGLARLLRWATKQNAIAEILHMAGEMFEARARGQAMFAGTVMAVLSVVIVLWGVFSVVGGLMLPMVTLISKLSG